MTQFEKRLAAVEAKSGMVGGLALRICIPPTDCPDVAAWERQCEAEATRDRVQPIIVRFVKPGDVAPVGTLQ